tara:strand:+ start:1199 stop:1417 length:219 start_codon:yes stop_codon:yes gene_type:complete
MGFLAPKPPALPPFIPEPKLPPAVAEDLPDPKKEKIAKLMANKKKGYTDTILTSNQGDTSEANIAKKTLLGG